MKNPVQSTGRFVLTTFDKSNYSATEARWHYIRYADSSEELYDRSSDPLEWTNLATHPELTAQKAALAKSLPDDSAYPAPAAGTSVVKKKKKAR